MWNGIKKTRILLFSSIGIAIASWLLGGCATTTKEPVSEGSEPATIQTIVVNHSGSQTVVDIVNSKSAPCTSFKLVDPDRVILDLRAVRGEEVPSVIPVGDGTVDKIRVEEGKEQALTTRVVLGLAGPVDYQVVEKDKVVRVRLAPTGAPPSAEAEKRGDALSLKGSGQEAPEGGYDPRVFFKNKEGDMTEVLGVDFTMLGQGRSRLTVTTDRKVPYDLKRKGPKTVALVLEQATIRPLLQRRLDSYYFQGAVDRVKAERKDHRLSFDITLREMVPLHVDQSGNEVNVEFGATSVAPPEKRMVPGTAAENEETTRVVRTAAAEPVTPEPQAQAPIPVFDTSMTDIPGVSRKKHYRGPNMTMDFVNAEVTNVLRLIGEVSDLNIIWGPEVRGTVSMRLKDVPWEQALDLVLANNDLAKREEGNIIWVAPKSKIRQLEEEERRKREEARAMMQQKKELEPLRTKYFPLDFADPDEIKTHIESILTERGKVSIDSRTNTLIIKDISQTMNEAEEIVERFDTAVKQIMIEARIVDASTDFSRDLGVKWNAISGQRRSDTSVPFGLPPDPTTGFSASDRLYGGSFSSNAPTSGWSGNIGLSFGKLTGSALGAITLDAELALAQTEGKAKVISAPKVLASNGEEAMIERGDTIYKDIVTADTTDVEELEATLSLTVTPTVSYNNYVTMEVEVTDDEAFADLSGKTRKSIETTLMVKSGETIVIGGIYNESTSETKSGIPWLKDVPVLGHLFGASTETNEKTELLIFLTPTVVETTETQGLKET